ncbi:3-isopropylmalate dehydratase small subunit [Blastomonas sp.]|uniref:3-isopropylmalate dehydratase small subunit n=1 Tax=Blastomonas sp. TaxID=1909299 RepID=UPI002638ED81|nr:3-isopropylmalate dehydratase small subunit [Blastomonas sp.]MDM7955894.1 3-isopropylmalate dehydratase small subunit [Blastomonas sp.]
MEPFIRVVGRAASLAEDNIDTDVIYPARFLTITAREGLGAYAFADRAFRPNGAPVLVAGSNFGCGSSREQAVWALSGCGVRCIIAAGFGEIFLGNCIRNGVLPVTLDSQTVALLHRAAQAGDSFTVDLQACTIAAGGRPVIGFVLPEPQRQALLNGWDETSAILARDGTLIDAFERRQRGEQPWLYPEAD